MTSRFHRRHGTRILGGSKAQSQQIYAALEEGILEARGPLGSDRDSIERLLTESCKYRNGSKVSILAASPTSVRGPHVPSLKLDEVDEIEPDIRESSMGMAMEIRGVPASVLMTSTFHRVGGPMAELIERGQSGAFPVSTFCIFEVLERCSEERSGPNLENCPQCPIQRWCHADRERHPQGLPKAKRSNGHYAIDSLIQKTAAVSPRVFKSDYLCQGPQAAGLWFTTFDESLHVTTAAEFDPRRAVHVSTDSGVFTGSVAFQTLRDPRGNARVNVFMSYLAEGSSAEANGQAIVRKCEQLCLGRRDRVTTDPSGSSRNAVGPTVVSEYLRAGLKDRHGRIEHWSHAPGSVRGGLELLEALLMSADGTVSLTIHPRCTELIQAFRNYRRAKRQNQWQDYPEDPQHPQEDLMDALRGGVFSEFPEGRIPERITRRGRADLLI